MILKEEGVNFVFTKTFKVVHKHALSSFFFLLITLICFGQSTETRYYKDKYLRKEVPKKKAKYAATKTIDGECVCLDVRDIKSSVIIKKECYRFNEPCGAWIMENDEKERDYNFEIEYADKRCIDSTMSVKDYFENNDSLDYTAPALMGDASFLHFIVSNVIYPRLAQENDIMGKVFVRFDVGITGEVTNIKIEKGANILLDKEAVRVIRSLKFSSPAMLHGKPIALNCVVAPFNFVLR